MIGRFWTAGVVSMVLLLASCGPPNPGSAEERPTSTARPTEAPSPMETLAVSPAEDAPSPTTAAPSPVPPSPTFVASPTTASSPTVAPSPTTHPSPTPPASPTAFVVASAGDVLRIGPDEANVLVQGGQAVLIDTRSGESYRTQHAAGAISLPESEAPGRLSDLPTDQALIFY